MTPVLGSREPSCGNFLMKQSGRRMFPFSSPCDPPFGVVQFVHVGREAFGACEEAVLQFKPTLINAIDRMRMALLPYLKVKLPLKVTGKVY